MPQRKKNKDVSLEVVNSERYNEMRRYRDYELTAFRPLCREFVYRYNNHGTTDGERTVKAIKGTEGKRLIYKEIIKKAGE